MPRGYGRTHPVVVFAGEQLSAPVYFDYDPPQILSVVPLRDVYLETSHGARCVQEQP